MNNTGKSKYVQLFIQINIILFSGHHLFQKRADG